MTQVNKRVNAIFRPAVFVAGGSLKLLSGLRISVRQALLADTESYLAIKRRLKLAAGKELAKMMDHNYLTTALVDYPASSDSSTKEQEAAYTVLQEWFERV
jgi:hypothetical protein